MCILSELMRLWAAVAGAIVQTREAGNKTSATDTTWDTTAEFPQASPSPLIPVGQVSSDSAAEAVQFKNTTDAGAISDRRVSAGSSWERRASAACCHHAVPSFHCQHRLTVSEERLNDVVSNCVTFHLSIHGLSSVAAAC